MARVDSGLDTIWRGTGQLVRLCGPGVTRGCLYVAGGFVRRLRQRDYKAFGGMMDWRGAASFS
jgi:hypothetical protein